MKMKGGKQMKKIKSRTNKGITLIALVIAIILEDGTAYYTEEEQARLTDNSMVLDASNYILFCDIAEDGGITEIKNGDYISVVGQFDENGRQLENAYIILE